MTSMQWLNQLFKRHKPQIPEALWLSCTARLPFLRRLTPSDLLRLKTLAEQFLAAKTITGVRGLVMTDEIAVLIAAQASLPVLNLTPDLYHEMGGVVVYPSAFIVNQKQMDAAGVLHEWREELAGEAFHGDGPVVLSWQDMENTHDFRDGHNVVIHEFAHKIDMGRGGANGCPPFLAAYHRGMQVAVWSRAFAGAYRDFCRRVHALERRFADDVDFDELDHAASYDRQFAPLPMDAYAATNAAEFFAVASEAFFVRPQPLAADYPEVYRLLALYYRQDPLERA
jgi:Mlc titration factor MtfA (ptsG expression regulator)